MFQRPFGKLGFEVSSFGLGAMRFASLPNNAGIDYDLSTKMIRHAIDHGVNYIDTAFVYLGGKSEVAVGKALQGGYRDQVKIATKLATWMHKPDQYEEQLDTSLARLGTDHVDFYLFHAVDSVRWEECGQEVMAFMDKMVKKGKILYPSFSFHDEPALFKTILDAYDWKMAQAQINILDEDAKNQASLAGIQYAASKGVPVVAMEPLRGGSLAQSVPYDVKDLYENFPTKRTAVEWAFRYLYDMPEIATILSGLSSMEQLEDNLRIFASAKPNCMDASEHNLISKVRACYLSRVKVGCTGCEYCLPCPAGVKIPSIFGSYDQASIFEKMKPFQESYQKMESEGFGQSQCIECGACEAQCPQGISIIEKLKEAAAAAK